MDYVKATKVFRRNKKGIELKILVLLYFFGLSSETSNFLSLFEEISHESVRIYYHRLKKVLKPLRRLIAIDEN